VRRTIEQAQVPWEVQLDFQPGLSPHFSQNSSLCFKLDEFTAWLTVALKQLCLHKGERCGGQIQARDGMCHLDDICGSTPMSPSYIVFQNMDKTTGIFISN